MSVLWPRLAQRATPVTRRWPPGRLASATMPPPAPMRMAMPARSIASSAPPPPSAGPASPWSSTTKTAGIVAVLAALAGAGYYQLRSSNGKTPSPPSSSPSSSPPPPPPPPPPSPSSSSSSSSSSVDYKKVYKAIADVLEIDPEYDGFGHFGPILVRLGWHASGSYAPSDHCRGGSNGATMRFAPEAKYGANKGLHIARDFLDRHVKPQFPGLSYADLWTLAAVVAIQEMGGPTIPWRPGRIDQSGPSDCPPNGRLPDGAKGAPHLRDIFYRMGFNDQEIVALTGAHALGRCHRERSGFEGPWTTSPTVFTNAFYTTLLDNTWVPKQWDGAFQYVDKATGELMMLPSDYALLEDPKMRVWVERYARDESLYFDHFAQAFGRLLELGVTFPADQPSMRFEALN